MKKVLSIIMLIIIALMFTACGKQHPGSEDSLEISTSSAESHADRKTGRLQNGFHGFAAAPASSHLSFSTPGDPVPAVRM